MIPSSKIETRDLSPQVLGGVAQEESVQEIKNLIENMSSGNANEEVLSKLTSIQQSIISGFASLFGSSAIFITDGMFTVPEGIYELEIYACAAGGVIYAGEYVIAQKISVTPGEQIPITVGNAQTEIGDYIVLTEASISSANNADCLNIGVTLGINGNAGGDCPKYLGGKGGQGGYGGGYGFGGGGGAAGSWFNGPAGDDGRWNTASGGSAHTSSYKIYIDGTLLEIKGATKGEDSISKSCDGKNGGNAGGFGAGAGTGGGQGVYTSGITDTVQGAIGVSGKGSQGLVIIKWGA